MSENFSMSARPGSGHLRAPRARHAGQRGSVIFIVLMGMLLLTSLGTWVVYASGLAASSAGYQRSASQTLYLSELAILSGTGHLAQPGAAGNDFAVEDKQRISGSPDYCTSIPSRGAEDECKAYTLSDINGDIVANGANGYDLVDITAGGSFSPYAATQEGDFRIEVTDLLPAEVMGTDMNSQNKPNRYQHVTITAYATLRPTSANLCVGAAGANAAATIVGMRAYSVIGPMTP